MAISTSVERFRGTYEAEQPISHGADNSTGITQRLRTMQMQVEDPETGERYMEDVPVISGNALRGQLRDLLAADFLDSISPDDEPVQVSDPLLSALYSGGALERGVGPGQLKRRMTRNIRENIPSLSLLGTAIGSQMIEGRLDMGMLYPLCMETRSYTQRGDEEQRGVYESFVDETYYTRSDDREGGREGDETVQQMRYKTHVLVPGTQFDHEVVLKGASGLERSCLGRAFELFSDRPAIGGMASRGHGQVSFEYHEPDAGLPSGDEYSEFLAGNQQDIHEFVVDLSEKVA